MKYTLYLDSSNKYLTVAISKDGELVDSISYDAYLRQSEVMVLEIDNIMKRNNLTRNDFDSIVVAIGPGSYTGVRIALVIAKTMAYALNLKVYSISSLELLKSPQKPTICVINAKANRVYFAVYDKDQTVVAPCVMNNEDAKNYIDSHPSFLISGDADLFGKESYSYSIVDALLEAKKETNAVKNIFTLNPVYLKDYYDRNDHLEFRKAEISDIDRIYEIEAESFVDPWNKESLYTELTQNPINNFVLLIDNKEIVGFINYMNMFTTATISQIAVAKKYRRLGFAEKLLKYMEQNLISNKEFTCEFITLEVRESNKAAIALYEKCGYEYITDKKNYYSDGETAKYFIKRLMQ